MTSGDIGKVTSMYTSIVCAIGLGPREKAVHMLRRASLLAGRDGKITAVNVIESVPQYLASALPSSFELQWIKEAENKLTMLCDSIGVQAVVVVKTGRAAPEILDVARDLSADLIIVGSHNQDISDAFFGSVVDRITRQAACSVLVDRQ